MIIDAHTHIFRKIHGRIADGPTEDGKWGAVTCGKEKIQIIPPLSESTQFTETALIKYMDIENINKAMLLQGCFYGNQNKFVKRAIENNPDRLAGAMYLEPFNGDVLKKFETEADGFKAIKLECSVETGFSGWGIDLNIADYIPLYRRIAEKNMVLILDLGHVGTKSYQTDSVKKIIDTVPELKIVICHLGQPRLEYLQDDSQLDVWKAQLELANYGNVWFDTASLAAYFASEIYPYKSGAVFFDIALNIASPSRIMLGTDIPGNSLIASYRQMIELPRIYSLLLQLNDIEIDAIMGANAEKVYFN